MHAGLSVRGRTGRQHLHLRASHLEPGPANWVACHILAFEFFNGTTKLIVPDNPRTGVDRACRYEPDLNRTYHEMAQHYGVAVMPARPYKPRDKAKVENAVLLVERWIMAALRHHRFFTLAELNQAIGQLLERLNHRPFRKREGTRASLFAEVDRPALQPLPAERYLIASGKPSAPTSITTSRSTVITTAFPIRWSANSWRHDSPAHG